MCLNNVAAFSVFRTRLANFPVPAYTTDVRAKGVNSIRLTDAFCAIFRDVHDPNTPTSRQVSLNTNPAQGSLHAYKFVKASGPIWSMNV